MARDAIDRKREQQELANQALVAWKRGGRVCDLRDYFMHQAKADRISTPLLFDKPAKQS